MERIGTVNIPELDHITPSRADDDGDGDQEEEDSDTVEDSRLTFKPGHIRTWWSY